MQKLAVSISDELDAALTIAAMEAGCSKSRALDIYLRESAAFRKYIDVVRAEPSQTVLAVGRRQRKRVHAVRGGPSSSE